jgi:hypothetical protein
MMAYKTFYKPKNKQKYIGDVENIVCRSLWERTVCKFCDDHPNIIKWSSEEIAIPYMHPIEKKVKNYYPDFLIQFEQHGALKTWMVEIKPKKQTMLKENASKKEKMIWAVNNAKWHYAKNYCDKNQIEFKIMTEKELFNK